MWGIEFLRWRRKMLQEFQGVTDSEQIFRILQQQAGEMAYDWYALCVRHPVPFTRPKFSLKTTYPEDWVACYQAENYFAIDPVLKPENMHSGYLVWDDKLFVDTPAFWDAARDHGLRQGATHCLVLPNRALGYLSLSRDTEQGALSDEEQQLRIQTLADLSMATLLRLEDEQVMMPEMKFSKRELEILKWTAEGKTSAEIALILSISENTVNFHQKNMQKKFNAPNKTQVACYAAAIGLI